LSPIPPLAKIRKTRFEVRFKGKKKFGKRVLNFFTKNKIEILGGGDVSPRGEEKNSTKATSI
jgi:hypothetical protein